MCSHWAEETKDMLKKGKLHFQKDLDGILYIQTDGAAVYRRRVMP